MHSVPARHPRAAFTLIELLTVIAIIGILAAILIPTVGKVREKARQSASISNLKQIAQALVLYASDNKGLAPVRDHGFRSPFWHESLAPYTAAGKAANGIDWALAQVFVDPLVPEGLHHGLSDYGANPYVITESHLPRYNIDKAPTPSRLVSVCTAKEGAAGGGCWYLNDQIGLGGFNRNDGVVADRGGTVLLAMLDGSTKSMLRSEVETQRRQLFRNE